MPNRESSQAQESDPTSTRLMSLQQRVQLCAIMLVLECFASFEEIFMVAVLRRESVPTSLVSSPGVISSINGLYIIPLLGWASDRVRCPCGWGQKRPYALLSLTCLVTGVSLLVAAQVMTLYDSPHYITFGNVTNNETDATTTEADVRFDGLFSAHGQSSGGISDITVVGCLAILGFALGDHSYSSSMTTFRLYMTAVTPASQHDSLMVLATLMGAVGGCVTSLLGYVDVAAVFLDSDVLVERGVFQCFVQAAVLLALVLVLGPVSLLTGSEPTADNVIPASRPGSMAVTYRNLAHVEASTEDRLGDRSEEYPDLDLVRTNSRDTLSEDIEDYPIQTHEETSPHNETTHLIRATSHFSGSKRNKIRKLVCLCVMAFLGFCTNCAYFVYVSNYVGEEIYKGDPFGQPDSDAYSRYVQGVHMSSLGMTLFYCLQVLFKVVYGEKHGAFNLLHGKVSEKVGMKAEYVISSVVCFLTMVTLSLTSNIVVFFATQVAYVAYRSVVYTVPFILVNKYSLQDLAADRKEGKTSSGSGFAMAVVTATLTVGNLLVSFSMGPLMALTGYPATPIVFAAASCALGTLATLFVKFE